MLESRVSRVATVSAAACLALGLITGSGCAARGDGPAAGLTATAGPLATPARTWPVDPEAAEGRTPWFDRGDFVSFLREDRLWVFDRASTSLQQFLRAGEPARSVTAVAAGPAGWTLRAPDERTLLSYLAHRDGYHVAADDTVVWVFEMGSPGMIAHLGGEEPATSTTLVGAGPRGRSLRSDDPDALLGYLAARPGFRSVGVDGRIWILREDDPAAETFRADGPPADAVAMVGVGPRGRTLMAPDRETILEWMAARPGFTAVARDGRIWIVDADSETGSETAAAIRAGREPAHSVSMPGAGPRGTTVRAEDRGTLLRWMGHRSGFEVFPEDGRLWVFDAGSEAAESFRTAGEPAKSITRIGAGPRGMSLRSDRPEVLDRYQRMLDREDPYAGR
ncbi:MAG: hypothetical protein ACYTEV_10575 [Planctomycetota bacterium]|jgi:hypothetical protein